MTDYDLKATQFRAIYKGRRILIELYPEGWCWRIDDGPWHPCDDPTHGRGIARRMIAYPGTRYRHARC